MQPSSFLDNIVQEPEFLSAVSRRNRINCATPKRLSSLINEQFLFTILSTLTQPLKCRLTKRLQSKSSFVVVGTLQICKRSQSPLSKVLPLLSGLSAMSHLRFWRASLTRVKDEQNRAELYSVNETRVSSTRHDATRVMPCHTWDFNARPLNAR